MLIQLVIIVFAVFALSRVVMKFREGSLSRNALFAWAIVWIGVGTVVLLPHTTSWFADIVGVGRGVDAAVYLAIILLYYLVFRIFLQIERIDRDITALVRKMSVPQRDDNADDAH